VFDNPAGSAFRLNLAYPWLRVMRLNWPLVCGTAHQQQCSHIRRAAAAAGWNLVDLRAPKKFTKPKPQFGLMKQM
jgi:hypothetical protein